MTSVVDTLNQNVTITKSVKSNRNIYVTHTSGLTSVAQIKGKITYYG